MKHPLATTLLVLACALGLISGCVKQNEYDALQQRVQTQDQQLRQLQPAQADTWAQMQAMRQDINTLKGLMDDLNNAGGARSLVDKVNRHEAALRQVETSLAMDLRLEAPVPLSGMPSGGTGMFPDDGLLAPGEAQAAIGAVNTPPPTGGTMVIAPQHAPTPPTPARDIATVLFDAGVEAFNARKYQEAERSFTDFTKNYPNDKQVPNAWYYIGECSFQRNQFADAALAYDKVISKYANSSRAPAAYLKQGIAFSKLGQAAAAKARMQELIKKYPNSAEAARAKSFLQTNK